MSYGNSPGRMVQCLTCGKIIQSQYRHDFAVCDCANEQTQIFIDGGSAYTRFGFGPKAQYRWADIEYDLPLVTASREINTEAGVYDQVPEVPSEDGGAGLPSSGTDEGVCAEKETVPTV